MDIVDIILAGKRGGGSGGLEHISLTLESVAHDGFYPLTENESAAFQTAADAGKDAVVFLSDSPLIGNMALYYCSENMTGGFPMFVAIVWCTETTITGNALCRKQFGFMPAALAEFEGDGWVCIVNALEKCLLLAES